MQRYKYITKDKYYKDLFFSQNLMPDSSVIGTDNGEYQDMIAISNYNIDCVDVS